LQPKTSADFSGLGEVQPHKSENYAAAFGLLSAGLIQIFCARDNRKGELMQLPAVVRLVLVISLACLAGCSGGSSSGSNSGSSQHLYLTTASGQILQFNLPVSGSSMPSVIVSNAAPGSAIAVDSSGDVVTGSGGTLAFYKVPLTTSSSPSFTFTNGSFTSSDHIAFNSAGDLFVSSGASVNMFPHPLSAGSTPSQTINFQGVFGMATDANGNLYTSFDGTPLSGSPASACILNILAPPYTGTIVQNSTFCNDTTIGALAAGSSHLFASAVNSTLNWIDVDALPGANTSTQIFLSRPGVMAVDGSENLYVVDNSTGNSVMVFAPPFSSNTPNTTLTVSGAQLAGIAVGR
jgi:hypothetical protein